MKKKIFTLMMLALISIGSAWGEYKTILLYDATMNSSITTTPTGDYVTLNGSVSQGSGNSMYGIKFVAALDADKYISVTLPSSATLAANDQIVITHYQSGTGSPNNTYGTLVTAASASAITDGATYGIPSSQGKDAAAVTYTVIAGDEFIGKSTFYVRAFSPSSSKSCFIQKIEVKQYYVDTRDALTLSFTPDNKTITTTEVLTTTLSWAEDTSSESAKYATTYESSNPAIAIVASDGKITGVATGTATITATVTADADATYKTTTKTIIVNVIAPFEKPSTVGTPTGVLDFTDASAIATMLNGTWNANYGRPQFGSDGVNNYMTCSYVTLYSAVSSQTWFKINESEDGGSSTNDNDWSDTGVFLGSAGYGHKAAATFTSAARIYSFCVKGVSKIQVLCNSKSTSKPLTLAAFEKTGSTVASSTIIFAQGIANSIETLTINLDPSKEYVVATTTTNTSNTRVHELALFYDNTTDFTNVEVGEYEWATFVSDKALDFTGSDVKAYVVTGRDDHAIVKSDALTTVAANTPLLLNATEGTYVIPVAASGTDYSSTNKLVAGDGTDVSAESGKTKYALSVVSGAAQFKKISSSATIPAGKAYLEFGEEISAREFLAIDGSVTGIKDIKIGSEDNIYYDLSGRRVLYPTKGLYIVNGKKVIIK